MCSTYQHGEEIIGIFKNKTDFVIISKEKGNIQDLKFSKASQLNTHLEKYLFDLPFYLKGDVHVIISTQSGTSLASSYYDRIIAPLLGSLGVVSKPLYTTSPDSVKEFAIRLTGTVLLLSGDGGVNDLINHVHSRVTVVLFPLGTGNALCNSYIQDELQCLLRGSPKALPNFRATFSQATLNGKSVVSMLGAVIASYGFHAILVDESEKYRHMGDKRFEMVAMELLQNPPNYTGTVNGEKMKGYAAVTMVKKLDKNFSISPTNEFRMIHVDTLDLMKGYQEGLGAWKVDKVKFHAEGRMCVDGSILHVNGHVLVEEVESRIDLVTPVNN